MSFGDLESLAAATAEKTPFPHLLCPNFIRAEKFDEIYRDFPMPPAAGSFPLSSLKCGGAFAALAEEIRGAKMAEILSEKLGVRLAGRPTMMTVRGFCRATDGKVHLDSGGKIITVLLYLNRGWNEKDGGRLRLLRSDSLDDYFLETPPGDGALLAFRCDNNAWHGHLPFSGERRTVQLNWVAGEMYKRREAARHFISAAAKKARAVFVRRPA